LSRDQKTEFRSPAPRDPEIRNSNFEIRNSPESFAFVKEKAGIREFTLASNGLRLLLIQNRVAPVATVAIVYHVGSRNEAVGYTGATHLLEHLMFKGTPEFDREKGTAVAAMLEALGARFNATTWFDRTNYYETIRACGRPCSGTRTGCPR
jgi:zinc protease